MKKNLFVRVMAALSGVTLWCLGLCALAETFFHVPVTESMGKLLGARTPVAVLLTLLIAIVLCTFGMCCLLMLSSKRAAKRKGFVMQKGENGVIGVAIKSIEGLVQTCVRQHDTVHRADIAVVERRDGIVILLDIQEAAGVNIPLAVGALQKQIKQYVNECTGVDVREVRVMVENTEENVAVSPYAVKEPVVMTTALTAAELQREAAEAMVEEPVEVAVEEIETVEEAPAVEDMPEENLEPVVFTELVEEDIPQEEMTEAEPEPVVPAAQPVPVAMPIMPEMLEDEDDRPLHQRIFGMEEEPVFVPAPPELVIEPAMEDAAEEIVPVEEPVEEALPQEETDDAEEDAFAVLEVVEAVSGEIAEEIAAAEEMIAPAEENVEVTEEFPEAEAEESDEITNE